MMPIRGNNTNGSRAVTEMETVSLIHHTIIQDATARTFCASGDIIVIGKKYRIKNKTGPNMKPVFL
jgi:hypothetical protein